jgi:hypothetical protein
MNRINRYTLYYRLIDVCFVCQLLIITAFVYKKWDGQSGVNGVLDYPFEVVKIFGLLIPTLLVFQRWMRDDFSEALWQRTAGTVLKAVVILPIPVMFIVAVAIGTRVSVGLDPATDYTTRRSMGLPAALEGQLYGYITSMVTLWIVGTLLFIFAFQWHRWRASR